MHSKRQEYKCRWLLDRLSPKELQHGTLLSVPTKIRTNDIISVDRLITSTGIPASTIKRFQDGIYTPREKSIRKLASFYDRYAYARLRAVGANKENARKLRTSAPDDLTATIHRYQRWAKRIQANHAKRGRVVPLIALQYSMAHSQHGTNDWDKIAMTSGLQKYRHHKEKKKTIKSKRGRYQH